MRHKKTFLIILTLALIAPLRAWGETGSEPLRKFYQAGSAYQNGDYKKAIEIYKSIIKTGLESGAIYYNLANSYFKDNQLGMAVVNYERAKRFIPRDHQLEFNARYARSLVKSYAPTVKRSVFGRKYAEYKDSFTVNEFTWIVFVLFLLIGSVYTVGLFLKWPKQKVILAICVLSMLLVFHLHLCVVKLNEIGQRAVVVEQTDSKYEPTDKATNYFKLPEGEIVRIVKKEYGWIKVKRSDNKTGWVKATAIDVI